MFYDLVSDVYHQKRIKNKDKNDSQRYAEIESLCREQMLDISTAQRDDNLTKILESLKQDEIELMVYVKPYDIEQGKSIDHETELHVVGFWAADAILKNYKMLYVSDTVKNRIWTVQQESMPYYEIHTTKYVNDGEAFYTDIFLMYDHSSEQTQSHSKLYENNKYREDDSREKFAGVFIDNLEAVDDTIKDMSSLFLLAGAALAIFAALLLSNFISVSISQKQKDIGILRAIGAKGAEVFKIFLVETILIVSACIVVATIASIVICNIINGVMAQNLGAELFVFSIGSFVLLTLISTTTALAATYFPVNKAAKRKPIDSIRII
jgi:ABC-type antimicrobial peptide transport system permease subunit